MHYRDDAPFYVMDQLPCSSIISSMCSINWIVSASALYWQFCSFEITPLRWLAFCAEAAITCFSYRASMIHLQRQFVYSLSDPDGSHPSCSSFLLRNRTTCLLQYCISRNKTRNCIFLQVNSLSVQKLQY